MARPTPLGGRGGIYEKIVDATHGRAGIGDFGIGARAAVILEDLTAPAYRFLRSTAGGLRGPRTRGRRAVHQRVG